MENIMYIISLIIALYYYILLNMQLNKLDLCIDNFYNYEPLA